MELAHFAIIYQDQAKAWAALRSLKKLQQAGSLNLKKAVVMVREADGRFVAEESNASSFQLVNPKYGLAGLAGTVVGLVGAAPLGPGALVMAPFMGAVGTAAAIGRDLQRREPLPDDARQQVQPEIAAGSSAVIVQAEILDLGFTLEGLARLGKAKVIALNLKPGVYKELKTLEE